MVAISRRTVDTHFASIYAKLGISSRVQLITWLGAQPGRRPRPPVGSPQLAAADKVRL